MVPDNHTRSPLRTEQLVVKSNIEPDCICWRIGEDYKAKNKYPYSDRKTLAHSKCPPPLAFSPGAGRQLNKT